jgi:probable rRNA maturation factor
MTAPRRRQGAFTVEVIRHSSLWRRQPEAEKTVQDAVAAAAGLVDPGRSAAATLEVAVVLADDVFIQNLNRIWRGRDTPTNVLSFPTKKPAAGPPPTVLGDIVIAYETVAQEAVAQRKRFLDHVAHLAVHGFLHLFGYDHESGGEADAMEALERKILRELGMPDPYAATTPAHVINR